MLLSFMFPSRSSQTPSSSPDSSSLCSSSPCLRSAVALAPQHFLHSIFLSKFLRIRTFGKHAHNSHRIRTFEIRHLKSFRIRSYEKTGGGAPPSLATNHSALATSLSPRSSSLRWLGRLPLLKLHRPHDSHTFFHHDHLVRLHIFQGVDRAAGPANFQ